jgi:protein-disulfide isomerase-like protein with CxxC motif
MEKQLPARGGYQFTDGVKRQWFNTDNQQLVAAFKQRFTERSTHLTQQLAAHGIPTLAISTHDDALTVLRSQYRSQHKKKSTAPNVNDSINGNINNKLKAKGGSA